MNTIPAIIEKRIADGVGNTAFTFLADGETARETINLSELRRASLAIAARLRGHRAALICLPQGLEFIKAFVGCLYASTVAVPVAAPSRQRGVTNLQEIISESEISAIVTNRQIFENCGRWFGENVFGAEIEWLLIENVTDEAAPDSPAVLPRPAQTAFLQYTSGSTGNPKAVVVTHENIIENSRFIQHSFQNDADSVSVCWLPSFHDMGLIDGVLQPIFSNFPAVLLSPAHFLQKPARWLKALSDFRATYSGAPNFAFDFCAERIADAEIENLDLSSLRCLYNGSEPVRARTIRRFVERFKRVGVTAEKMFACYGLAEATLAVTTARLGAPPRVLKIDDASLQNSKIEFSESEKAVELVGCGFPDARAELKIVNPVTFTECAEREIGEIWTAGKSVAAGYQRDAPLTAKTFVASGGERFLRTGDTGFLSGGELFVTGRIKDVIIIRGKNHSPQDIEETVSHAHDALQKNACAAFSAEFEDGERLIVAQEIKRAGRVNLDFARLFAAIVSEVTRRHGVAPQDVVLIAPAGLPKTTSGKIRRAACRKLWLAGDLPTAARLRDYIDF